MTEREGRDREDLFEDLDKFFAPIRDVEWPEPPEPDEVWRERAEGGETAEPAPAPDRPSPGGVAAGVAPAGGEPGAEPPEELRAEEAEPPEEVPPEELRAEEPPGEAGPPEPPEEEPPSAEALEAAAEHFAESIRVEAGGAGPVEAEGGEAPTEELLADLTAPPTAVRVGGAETLRGPSWQEPTAVEVEAVPEARPGPRDVPAAFLTGLVLAAVAIGSLALSKLAFAVVAGVLVLVAQGELYGAMHRRHRNPATAVGLVTGALVLAAAYAKGEAAMLAMLALGTAATFLWYMATPAARRQDVLPGVAATLLPVVYVALLAGYALTTLALPTPPDGRALLLAVLGLTFVYDTAAFLVGYFWGSRPLAPTVSPRKSWEGAIGATLVVVAVSVGVVTSTVETLASVVHAVGLAAVVAVFAPLGDLAESLLKRDLGVKDMGSLLPGHGGVLDRIDSVLFVAPAALVYFRLILA